MALHGGFLVALAAMLPAGPPNPRPDANELCTSRLESRVVKSFDFDEQKLGNYESMPRFWRQIREAGYPRYLEPTFDYEVGHSAPPSFRLSLAGGSVGAAYLAKDIDVHPSADYQVSAWIRPLNLVHARAYVSAYYLDHAFHKIEASERCSRLVQGGSVPVWTQVVIHLPGGFESAAWLGLSCRVEQQAEGGGEAAEPRPINYRDVHAAAWFDDIMVLRLPKVSLALGAEGNAFVADQPVRCQTRVADLDGAGLNARIELADADGRTIATRPVLPVGLSESGAEMDFGNLPAGWYTASLIVEIDGVETLSRRQSFVKLNPDLPWASKGHEGFGVILDDTAGPASRTSVRLLEALGAGAVKVPLWRRTMDDRAVVLGEPDLDDMLRRLHARGIRLVATLDDPPAALAEQCGHPKLTLLDVLSRPPDQWRAYLAFILARHGPQIGAWQIGTDRTAIGSNRHLATALSNIRAELQPLIGPSDLVVPQSAEEGSEGLPGDPEVVSMTVPEQLSGEGLTRWLEPAEGRKSERSWVTIEAPSAERYQRWTRLVEFARRLILTRASGAEMVFLRQPWTTERQEDITVVTPDETFIIYRTLAQALGGLRPIVPIWLGHGVEGWVFGDDSSDQAVIAAWTEGDQSKPREIATAVGPQAVRTDLWGNIGQVAATKDGPVFLVDAMPILIAPVSCRRARVLAGFEIDEPMFQAAVGEQPRLVTLANPQPSGLRGTLVLRGPGGWRVRPDKIAVNLGVGEKTAEKVNFIVPGNQAAGEYVLTGRLAAEGDPLDGLILQAPLYVGSPGLEVNVMTRREEDRLIVLQRITNRTAGSLHLQTALITANRPRQTRVVSDLSPGQTTVRQFELEHARSLSGQFVRVSVEQVDGPLRHHDLLRLD
jgi:hypothetical protein